MPKVTDVREIVSSHIVTREDGKSYRLEIIRYSISQSSWGDRFSYTCEVFERTGGRNQVHFPMLKENDPEQLKAIAFREIEKL